MILIGAMVVIGLWMMSKYNGMVSEDENVKNAWANVEAAYQRRMDLIPNLVNVAKGGMAKESEAIKDIIEARAKATAIQINADSLDEETMAKFQEAQSQLSGSLSRLMAVSEAYPELKTAEAFTTLQAQLEGTENRINESRKAYNAAVQEYNPIIRSFPGNIVASIFGFKVKAPFQADADAKNAPKVEI